ncbi:MAG: hypothetical protein AAFN70_08580, partial [Planctomycetota bacterium]
SNLAAAQFLPLLPARLHPLNLTRFAVGTSRIGAVLAKYSSSTQTKGTFGDSNNWRICRRLTSLFIKQSTCACGLHVNNETSESSSVSLMQHQRLFIHASHGSE